MPSKLRKAIGAVKDQTSISLAKVTNAENLEVLIIKATTHDEIPIEERYINEILSLVSSNKNYASACAQSIGKRIGKTKNWIVALKSLMIILRIFQDGDPYFPREVLHVMKGGSRILNLSGFRDDSSSSPWEYTTFVRLTALYLDERLDCLLTGKLQRRMTLRNNPHNHHQHQHQRLYKNYKMFNETMGTKDMKPSLMLEKITFWQRMLDRAMGTRPTGEAKTNRLVQISLYAIVQETFDIYRDISDGLIVILDSFFKLPYKSCLSAFQACLKSCKQFDELSDFYSFCLSIGVGRSSEYPRVQKISEELMETLQDFLKDQASNDNTDIEASDDNHNNHQHQHQHHRRAQSSFHSSSQYSPLSKHLLLSSLSLSVRPNSSRREEGYDRSYGTSPSESSYETASEKALPRCTSLEDLMFASDAGILAPMKFEPYYGGRSRGRGSGSGRGDRDHNEKQSEKNDCDDDASSTFESCSNHSTSIDRAARSSLDIISFNEQNKGDRDCWEVVLAETASKIEKPPTIINNDVPHHHQYNPFLELDDEAVSSHTCSVIDQTQRDLIDLFDCDQNPSEPTRMAPTFIAQSSSFETDLASIFGGLDLNTSCEIVAGSSSLQDVAENNLALVPCFQENNNGLNFSSTSIFQSQGSFKTNSASASASHGYELYQRSIAPGSNSQGLFQIHDTNQMSTRPTFNSQKSFNNVSSTSSIHQNHDSQTFNSQNSFIN